MEKRYFAAFCLDYIHTDLSDNYSSNRYIDRPLGVSTEAKLIEKSSKEYLECVNRMRSHDCVTNGQSVIIGVYLRLMPVDTDGLIASYNATYLILKGTPVGLGPSNPLIDQKNVRRL
jgi:hypothetical protein